VSAEHHKAVVRRLVPDVFNRGQLELLDELYDPSLAGRAKAWIGPFRNSFTDLEMEIVDLVAEGQWPPGSSAPEPIPATGSAIRQPDDSSGACPRCTSSSFTDGRIIKAWGLEDTYLRLRQLGLL
jgi:hypothetical protein